MDLIAIGTMLFAMVFVLLCMLVVLKACNTDNKARTKYDERQQMVRGQGYKAGFWGMAVLLTICIILSVADAELPMEDSVLYFVIFMYGIMVQTIYCVMNDGYFGINNRPRQYYIMFFAIGLLNVGLGVLNYFEGRLIVDGKLSTSSINLICGLCFVILGIAICIKNLFKKKDDDEDYDEDEE